MLVKTPLAVAAMCTVAQCFVPSVTPSVHAVPFLSAKTSSEVDPSGEQSLAKQQQEPGVLRPYGGALAPMRRFVDMFDALERQFFGDDDFGSMMQPFGGQEGAAQPLTRFAPTMGQLDISETDKEVQVAVDLPGLTKKDIKVTLDKGLLTISAERKDEKEEKDKNYFRQERSFGMVKRVVRVPDSVDARASKVHADFKDGVLKITMEKSPHAPDAKGREIAIE